ncbi:MAG: restriction endonuclease subunit S [Bacteroides sp.]|nr:restriction endonuclease subunit S [Bacteroides sp.]
MKEWKLKECCLSISDGDHLPPSKSNAGIPFITISNIDSTNHLDFKNTLFVPIEYYDKLDSIRKAQIGDILYSVVGSFGKPVLIKDNKKFAFQRHIAILRPNSSIVDSRYLYYVMLTREFYMQADSVAIGAAQRTISLTSLRNMKVKLPSLDFQQRIATILSRYDSLIENYQKQIKLLEESAQRLYKEWFIDLRFPGHENTKIVDGVPEGWEKICIDNLVGKLESGSRPKGGIDTSIKDGVASVGAENVIGLGQYNFSSEKLVSYDFYNNAKKGRIENKDILIYKDGAYIGRTSLFQDNFPHKEAMINEHVFLLHTKKEVNQYFLFFTLYQKVYFEKMQKLNKNAAQPGLNQNAIKSLKLLMPNEKLIVRFDEIISPMMKVLFDLANQIRHLTEARDRLLPKLMSGEIKV